MAKPVKQRQPTEPLTPPRPGPSKPLAVQVVQGGRRADRVERGVRQTGGMRAIQVRQTGGPEVLGVAEVDRLEAGPGQALVRVTAAGVNFIDTYHRSGLYPKPLPFTPGGEAAGVVEAVGDGVTEVRVGDRVAGIAFDGAYQQFALAQADKLVPVPDGVTDELAAAALLQGMTAHYLLRDVYRVQAGDPVLVHAGAGGMGLLLTQLAVELGATVLTTVSTPEKADLSRAAGAAHVLEYDQVPARVRELTGGRGVAAVYDGVGRATFDGSLASLRIRGTLALFGYASGPIPPFDINRLQTSGSILLTRPTLGHFTLTRDELLARADYIFQRVAAGTVNIRVGGTYALDAVQEAHRDLEARRTTGKLLIEPWV